MKPSATTGVHIGFDLDGVLLDHTAVKAELAAAAGYSLQEWQTASDRIREHIPTADLAPLQDKVYGNPDHAFRSPLMRGALGLLTVLRERAVHFTLISRRRDRDMAQRVLDHHGLSPGFFDAANTVFTDSIEGKARECRSRGITHYLDDEQAVLTQLGVVPNRYLLDSFGRVAEMPGVTVVRTLGAFASVIGVLLP